MSASLNENRWQELPGFNFAAELIGPDEEAFLIERIEACCPQAYQGDRGGLRAISYGWRYDLDDASFAPCEPMPAEFAAVRDAAARFAGIPPESIVQCLFNSYETGAEIPWHCDKSIWENVVGVSLGASATMRFRRQDVDGYRYAEAPLPRRSIYALTGRVRHQFDHSIPPVEGRRWSITFRTFSDEGEKLRERWGV